MKTEKEILETVRVLQEANPHDEGIQNWVRYYFPELKESGDERIRNFLIDFIKVCSWTEKKDQGWPLREECIAWLEKQGEKLPFEMKTVSESLGFATQKECDYYNKMVTDLIMSDDGKGEQKPAWSEEDELMLVSIIQTLKLTNGSAQMKIDWLKSLKERIPPKSTWSEEDEVKINRIVGCLENLNVADNDILLKDVVWLKSLRPQNRWKPSDEQMEALNEALSLAKNCGEENAFDLRTLHDDLKRLLKK